MATPLWRFSYRAPRVGDVVRLNMMNARYRRGARYRVQAVLERTDCDFGRQFTYKLVLNPDIGPVLACDCVRVKQPHDT